MLTLRVVLLLFLFCIAACDSSANNATEASQVTFPQTQGVFTTRGQPVSLTIELALTPAQQRMGLMFRQSLPDYHGMLFIFNQQPSMWMKNTYLPLDMLFLNSQGEVVDITRNTIPFSEDVITTSKPAIAVLEIPAGRARSWGIRVGDILHVPQILPQQ